MKDTENKAKKMAKHGIDLFNAGFHSCKTEETLLKDAKETMNLFKGKTGVSNENHYLYYKIYYKEIKKLLKIK